MKWGAVREADLTECLAIEPRHLGDEIAGRERALAIWRDLIRSRAFNSVVVKADTPVSADQIVAFGSSVFVTADFATQELQHPRPGLNDRLVAGLASEKPVVRAGPGLGDAGAALDIVILSGNWRDEYLHPEQAAEIGNLMARVFVESHIGYELNRILCETKGGTQRRHLEAGGGVWRMVERFAGERTLFAMTRKEALSVSGSLAGSLFQYKAPVLHLRDTEKHLLAEALNGGTDAELATRINLSASSIKKRWRSLFEKIADARPDLLPDGDDRGGDESRGPQKRHHILAYVRSHPEELRPFRWPSSGEF
jgi:DNA-binding CsgD family transcriptional regulator